MANNTFRIPIPIGHPIYEVNNGHIEEYEVIGYRIGRMMGEDQEDYEEDYGDYDGWRIEYGMSTPADNRKLRKIIYTATGYGILTKAEIDLIAKIVGRAIDRELEKTEGSSQ